MSLASIDTEAKEVRHMVARFLLAAFLLGHAAIHTGFLSPRPPATVSGPPWPFALDSSWALTAVGIDAPVTRLLGMALVVTTLGGFVLAAVAGLGVLPASVWPGAAAVGAIASMALLLLFFHPWLILGLAIDVVLLWAVLVARWVPEWLTT
jgi:hypothetical protein